LHKKLFSTLLTVALVGGLLALAATPAQAARPFNVQQFMPNDTQNTGTCAVAAPGCTPDSLSDKFDGIDSLAHLTAVATPETDSVTWYACPLVTTFPVSNSELTNCNITIGSDATGVIPPIGPSASSPADEAYDVTWDVPGSLDNQRRDILALACIGSGQELDTNPNCRDSLEENIFLEDAQTGAAQNQTTAGEFGQYRTRQACLGVASGDATCDPLRKAFPHGSAVPNTGFDFLAFTSDDVNALQWEINKSDAQAEPAAANFDGFGGCGVEQTFTNFKRWLCNLADGNVPDDTELAISLLDANGAGAQPEGTAGYCNSNNAAPANAQNTVAGAHDACVLDVHYIVSSARQVTSVVQTFAANPPSPSASASCATPDTDESSQLGTTEDATICLFDQFTDPFNGPWTEATSGQGKIADCGPEGTGHDHNGDGVFEDCVGATGADGTSTGITLSNTAGPTGDQVLTSCSDPQNQTTNPPVANHGCADATGTLVKTLTIHWGTSAREVFVAYTGTGTAADPCRTGDTFARGEIGQHEDLVVCTFDSNGNPVPTDADGSRIQWTITGAHGNDQVAVRFNPNPPPDETTGSAAQAAVGIDDVAAGDNFIQATLLDSNGDFVDDFAVEKEVAGSQVPRNVRSTLDIQRTRRHLRFTVGSPANECEGAGRTVTLFMRQPGADANLGSKQTNSFSRAGFGKLARGKTYYGRVAASNATDANGDPLRCGDAQSNDKRIPRRHRR